ncbi:hypothetical protein ACLKMY_06735 [Paraburkholderia mimosarum]|uniref:hypothetical protein n=1 Tax=Paraburkholderia mimosarum TaxID=312026 RepID=UPI0039C317C2
MGVIESSLTRSHRETSFLGPSLYIYCSIGTTPLTHERPAVRFDQNQAWSIKTSTINLTGSISTTRH